MAIFGVCVLCCSAIGARAPDRVQDAASPEAEVVANLKHQPIGNATVADLEMPDEYLRRVAGRILRASFEENFRIVVPEEKDAANKDAASKDSGPGAQDPPRPIKGSESAQTAPKLGLDPAAGFAKLSPMLRILFALLVASVAAVIVAVRVVRRRGARPR
jgi:hypothetical protein